MRRPLCQRLLAILGSFVLLLGGAIPANADDRELQGNWKVVSLFRDGAPVPRNGGYAGILIHDNKIVFGNVQFVARTLRYRTDWRKSPMHLDVFDEQGKELLIPGIFELEKDSLRLCQGSPRPTAFETKKDDGRELFVLKRGDKN
jgi:uncharacterized protein (TIGR03067 family)